MLQRIALAVAATAALAVTGTAAAANGAAPNKSSSSISPPIVVSTSSFTALAASGPRYGDTISFTVSTTATTQAHVDLKCFRNGALLGEGWAAFFAGGTPGTFGLASPQWAGGEANCTADLGMFATNGKWKVLATTSFHVGA
jgi:hypothetical protein